MNDFEWKATFCSWAGKQEDYFYYNETSCLVQIFYPSLEIADRLQSGVISFLSAAEFDEICGKNLTNSVFFLDYSGNKYIILFKKLLVCEHIHPPVQEKGGGNREPFFQ